VYWKEWLKRALRETGALFSPLLVKFLPPLLAPLFLYRQFGMGGLKSMSDIWKVGVCLLESYLLAFAGIYVWKLFASVPLLLRERDATSAQKDERIAELTKPLVRIELQRFAFGQRYASPEVVLSLTISTGDKPTTFRDWTLSTEDGEVLRHPWLGFDEAMGHTHLRMEAGHVLSGFLQFRGRADPEKQWFLSFMDHAGLPYKILIPKSILSIS